MMDTYKRKVLVIGLDGGELSLITEFRGHLPTLSKLIDQGTSGYLRSTVPPVTAPAWASFMTGKNPGKHGVMDFEMVEKGENKPKLINSTYIIGETLWDILSRSSLRVIVQNVPLTYPPKKVNGVMITDRLTPPSKNYTYPPELEEKIRKLFGDFRPQLIKSHNTKEYFNKSVAQEMMQTKIFRYLLKKYDWDFAIIEYDLTDTIPHLTWNYAETNSKVNFVFETYKLIDKMIGLTLEDTPPETMIFVVSDHGMHPIKKAFSTNRWLIEMGMLKFRNGPNKLTKIDFWLSKLKFNKEYIASIIIKTKIFPYLWKISEFLKIDENFDAIDWSATKAFSRGHLGQIYLNQENMSMDEYYKIRSFIINKLKKIRDPETNEYIVENVFTRESIYKGEYVDKAADILFITHTEYIPFNRMDFYEGSYLTDIDKLQSAGHAMEGLLIVQGEDIKNGHMVNANIYDVMPTILHILNMPIPSDVDGIVLKDIFKNKSEFYKRKVEICRPIISAPNNINLDSIEEEEIKDRLRNLGYF